MIYLSLNIIFFYNSVYKNDMYFFFLITYEIYISFLYYLFYNVFTIKKNVHMFE
jgi:hypothetical protein